MSNRAKPLGITLIALYSALAAFMLVPVGCAASLVGQAPGIGGFVGILGYLFTLLGLVSCAVVYGLWTLQDWGRSLAYWLYLASIPLGLIAIFPPLAGAKVTAGNTVLQLVTIAIDLFIIVYLSKPNVIQLFSPSAAQDTGDFSQKREPY